MRALIKNTVLYAFSLFLASQAFSGVLVSGGITTLLIAGLALAVLKFILSPILHILTLPLNIASLGAFTFVINGIILYILTILIPQVTISAFQFPGFRASGFIIPAIYLNTFFAYIVSAFFISLVVGAIKWLIKD